MDPFITMKFVKGDSYFFHIEGKNELSYVLDELYIFIPKSPQRPSISSSITCVKIWWSVSDYDPKPSAPKLCSSSPYTSLKRKPSCGPLSRRRSALPLSQRILLPRTRCYWPPWSCLCWGRQIAHCNGYPLLYSVVYYKRSLCWFAVIPVDR